MFKADDYWKNIERKMSCDLSTFGKTEREVSQHLGHVVNHEFVSSFDEILGNIERIMTGQKKHGFEQNKKTELEKLQEKGKNE